MAKWRMWSLLATPGFPIRHLPCLDPPDSSPFMSPLERLLLTSSLYFFLSRSIPFTSLRALSPASYYLFFCLLSSLLFPHFMKAGIIFVLFTSDSPAPRAFSVKHEEGNQETVVEWVCLTGQKCFTLDLSHNKNIGNIDYFFLFLLLLCNYMMPSVTCAIIHIWRKKRKVFQFLPLIFTPNMGYAFPSTEKKFDLSPILI